jgi:cell division protein ZapA
MEKENSVEIKVLGQTYTVKTDAEESHIQDVVRYVNEKIDEILKKTRTVSSLNVAVLAALNIADDLLKEREKRRALLQEVEVKSRDLVEKIDRSIEKKGTGKVSFTESETLHGSEQSQDRDP